MNHISKKDTSKIEMEAEHKNKMMGSQPTEKKDNAKKKKELKDMKY